MSHSRASCASDVTNLPVAIHRDHLLTYTTDLYYSTYPFLSSTTNHKQTRLVVWRYAGCHLRHHLMSMLFGSYGVELTANGMESHNQQ